MLRKSPQLCNDHASLTTYLYSAIKFKRMKEKFGTVAGGVSTPGKKVAAAAGGDDDEDTPKKKRAPKTTPGKKGSAKKRKLDDEEISEDGAVKEEEVQDVSTLRQGHVPGELYLRIGQES